MRGVVAALLLVVAGALPARAAADDVARAAYLFGGFLYTRAVCVPLGFDLPSLADVEARFGLSELRRAAGAQWAANANDGIAAARRMINASNPQLFCARAQTAVRDAMVNGVR